MKSGLSKAGVQNSLEKVQIQLTGWQKSVGLPDQTWSVVALLAGSSPLEHTQVRNWFGGTQVWKRSGVLERQKV